MFWIQRAPWQKFALFTSIGYSVLFGFSIYYIASKIKATYQLFLAPLLLLTFLIGFHYIFTFGKMFPEGHGQKGYHQINGFGMHHSYPDYLYEARDFINSQEENFKILLLPDEKAAIYNWGYSGAALPSLHLFNKGLIFRQYGEGFAPPNNIDAMHNKAINLLYNEESLDFVKLLGLPEFIKKRLLRQPGLTFERAIGEWDFYKIDNNFLSPVISLYKHKEALENDIERIGSVKNAITFDLNHLAETSLSLIDIKDFFKKLNYSFEDQNESVQYSRINNSKIIIELNGIKGPYSLNFLENFDKNWKAYIMPKTDLYDSEALNKGSKDIENNSFSKARLNDTWFAKDFFNNSASKPVVMGFPSSISHYKSHNFANSWALDTKEICEKTSNCVRRADGSFDVKIVLEFWPLRIFYISAIISIILLIISIIYLVSRLFLNIFGQTKS